MQVDTGGQPHEIKDHSQATLAQQSDISQSLLGDHLNLYQIHSATLESGVLEVNDVLLKLPQLFGCMHLLLRFDTALSESV